MIDAVDFSRKKVLVVEDDPAISDLLATVIGAEGLDTVSAFDGETALDLAQAEAPDLITLDLALPRKDGHEVLHALEANQLTKRIPVIVVSAYTNRLHDEDYQHVKFVVNKPFDVDDLINKIRLAIANHRSQPANLGATLPLAGEGAALH